MEDDKMKKRRLLELPKVFHSSLSDENERGKIKNLHKESQPYKYAVVEKLFEEKFLHKARDEIVNHISFKEKETDIYRIFQTGDLTNLSGLPESEKKQLATLIELRDALYSAEFREFIQDITGCGPLSGVKTDMSCNEYNQGCYLLNHDDVIGTRRVSFILYLPLEEPAWVPEWGGSLELYPVAKAEGLTEDGGSVSLNVPVNKPSKIEPPRFNRFVFFEVQPGHSFHSVEEVVVEGDGLNGGVGARLSLSGWFHVPMKGEVGYNPADADLNAPKSSLQQLYSATMQEPKEYQHALTLPIELKAPEIQELSELINPIYLAEPSINQLALKFEEESVLTLLDFLRHDVAVKIEDFVRASDTHMNEHRRGVTCNGQVVNKIPPHSEGDVDGWSAVGPPHLQRYYTYTKDDEDSTSSASTANGNSTGKRSYLKETGELLWTIQSMFNSDAFRLFLAAITMIVPMNHTTSIRRFRPGLDYTLARGEPLKGGDYRLDVSLCLTPDSDMTEWNGRNGGWDVWLASDESSDEATYGAANDDSGVLMALEPDFNRLQIVLRDPGVLKFTKYLQAALPSCKYDVTGEWAVQIPEDVAASDDGTSGGEEEEA